MKKNYALLKVFIVLLSLVTVRTNAQLSGIVTINSGAPAGGTNYQTFTALANTLAAVGVNGTLVVNVVPAGGYTEQPLFANIPGTSATNTITVNGNGALLTFNSSNFNQPWTLGFNGADWMHFNNLNVSGTGTYAYACELSNQSSHNTFSSCTFSVPNTSTSSNYMGIVLTGSLMAYYYNGDVGDYNTWTTCTVSGGYYGVSMYAQYPAHSIGNQILNCTVTNFYAYGIAIFNYAKNYTIKGNLVNRPNRTNSTTVIGIYSSYNQGVLIEGNRVQNLFDSHTNATNTCYGIYATDNSAGGGKTNPNTVRNNVVSDIKHNGTQYGLYVMYLDGWVYHNTISLDNATSTAGTTRGIFCGSFTGNDTEVKNNNVSVTRGGTGTKYALYASSVQGLICDKNNLYINAPAGTNNVGYWNGTACSNLAALQALGAELNGFSTNPLFTSLATQNYIPTSNVINNVGAPVGVIQDINLNPRSGTQPDIGAFEFLSINCAGTPSANAVSPLNLTVCPGENALLGLTNYYSDLGISYQWQYSYTSAVGPWTNIPVGGTTGQLSTPTMTQNTYYGVVITCAFGGGTINPTTLVNIAGVTTSVVPYHESFEGITKSHQLPNCSWKATNIGVNALTYTTTMNQNRNAHTGNKYGAFYAYYFNGSSYFYSNGIQLNAGITYSASLWYQTDFYTGSNVTDMSIMYGTTQSTTGLVSIASTNGIVSAPIYKALANTFTVPTSGIYYVAVKLTSDGNYGTSYVSWDDLDIIIPCSLNSPTVSVNTSTTTVCKGEAVTLNASGADDYTWSNGTTGGTTTDVPFTNTIYTVVATNTLSGCAVTRTTQMVAVQPSPSMLVYTTKPVVCSGKASLITAYGADNYSWLHNQAATQMITVTPSVTSSYVVVGTNSYNCSSSATIQIVVNPNPTVNVTSNASSPNQICKGESAMLTGNGAASYSWAANTMFIQSPVAMVNPVVSTIYTLTGSDANGCEGMTTYALNVDECTGINKVNATLGNVKLYPNPTAGTFVIELNSSTEKTVEVIDLTGRVIIATTSSSEKMNVNISSFANGIYYVKVKSDKGVDVIKVVKH